MSYIQLCSARSGLCLVLVGTARQCYTCSENVRNLKIKIYRTVILPVVLYWCETWSMTLREERKLRVFEIMVLRRIFGPRRDEVTGGMEEIA